MLSAFFLNLFFIGFKSLLISEANPKNSFIIRALREEKGELKMRMIMMISYVLMFIGALNWGLVGLFNFDLVAAMFGGMSLASNIIYGLVGLAAIANLASKIAMDAEISECCPCPLES